MNSKAKKIKRLYRSRLWPAAWVRDAHAKGRISSDDLAAIIAPWEVVDALGSRPSKADLLGACETLGLDAPEGATNTQIGDMLAADVEQAQAV